MAIPAVVPGTRQSMVPPELRPLNQIPAVVGNRAALHDLLRSVGVLSARPRIFISYLRSEASVLAEQLHTELGRKGFEVFLDRFSVSPGADFQKRLDEELIRMGTVLFIESKNSHKSRWIRHETDFALLHRLGTISLRLPDGKPSPLVTPDDRLDLDDRFFTKIGRLKKSALEKILLKIAAAQALSENMRMNYLTGTVSSSLAYAGFANQSFSSDQVIVARKGNGPEHVVRISGLPTELQDFHALDPYAPSGDSLVISPGRLMNWRSKDPIEWLGRRISVKLIDESEIAEFPRGLR
ncbi:toll/interleukin-1 receptor domain-containing protein [Massilia rubra]|nr:toll/interleukin-1 receptor domain-containing protein [Massilia rubra]